MPPARAITYAKIISQMQQYEEHKYLPPKFTELMAPLSEAIGLPQNHPVPTPAPAESLPSQRRNPSQQHRTRLNTYDESTLHRPSLPPQDAFPKRSMEMASMFDSTHDLKSRKTQYQPLQSSESNSLNHTGVHPLPKAESKSTTNQSLSNPTMLPKHRKNLRYRALNALNALQEAQQNVGRMRVNSRRRLKTDSQA